MKRYLTLSLDEFDMLESVEIEKNDILLTENMGVIWCYKVNKTNVLYPPQIFEYYFGNRENYPVIELNRVKFTEIVPIEKEEALFEIIFNGDVEFNVYLNIRPSKNQVFYYKGKLFKVLRRTDKQGKQLTFDTELIPTKPMTLLYYTNHGTVTDSYYEQLQLNKVERLNTDDIPSDLTKEDLQKGSIEVYTTDDTLLNIPFEDIFATSEDYTIPHDIIEQAYSILDKELNKLNKEVDALERQEFERQVYRKINTVA